MAFLIEQGKKIIDGFMGIVDNNNFVQYHNNWDNLMRVVEKIEKDFEYSVTMAWQHCIIENAGENKQEIRIETDSSCKREATFMAIVEFIKWYNEQKEG